MKLECNPHDNLDDPNACRACGNDGRPDCGGCGGEEPRTPAQLDLADLIVAQQERVSIAAAKFYRFVDSLEGFADDDAAE